MGEGTGIRTRATKNSEYLESMGFASITPARINPVGKIDLDMAPLHRKNDEMPRPVPHLHDFHRAPAGLVSINIARDVVTIVRKAVPDAVSVRITPDHFTISGP